MFFAQIDENNIVIQVIEADQAFIDSQYDPSIYIETDPAGVSPKNFAAIGYTYRQALGGFVPKQNYPSWVLNDSTCLYEAPSAKPQDGKQYAWDEPSQSWIEQD